MWCALSLQVRIAQMRPLDFLAVKRTREKMSTSPNFSLKARKSLMAAAASVAIASAIGFGAVTTGTLPVFAEAVRVDGPQAPGFANVVEHVSPAVVSVRVKAKIEPASDDSGSQFFNNQQGFDDLPDDHPLKRFFREFRGEQDHNQGNHGHSNKPRPVAQGFGFFISEVGYLVTNNHVVDGGAEFTVVMDDGAELDAKLIGTDPCTDLAVLKVDDSRKF